MNCSASATLCTRSSLRIALMGRVLYKVLNW
jgi:hypothetical protein